MILAEDTGASQEYAQRVIICKQRKQILKHGDRAEVLSVLEQMLGEVEVDEENVRVLCSVSTDITKLMCSEDETVSDLASTLFEACVQNCPPNIRFPTAASVQPTEFVTVPGLFSLRMHQSSGNARSIPHIVWPSSIVLARWMQLSDTKRWIQSVLGTDRSHRALELGGGTSVAGLSFAMQYPDFEVTLTDIDHEAVRNTAYNAKRLQRRGCLSSSQVISSVVLDWSCDHDFYSSETAEAFDVIIGADVVHEKSMAAGLWRGISNYLKPGGVAVIVNPSPQSREGADLFQDILRARGAVIGGANHGKTDGLAIEKSNSRCCHSSIIASGDWDINIFRVTDIQLRLGIEDETEDIPLDLYTIVRKAT